MPSPDTSHIFSVADDGRLIDLRCQSGVRIGLVISDDTTLVYSPVPQLIEAGSNSVEKPNAIMFSGAATERLATAA